MATLPVLHRDGTTLAVTGVLDRTAAPAVWRQLLPLLPGLRRIDLSAVQSVDSAGLALLAEACARLRRHGEIALAGVPRELDELRIAYRLGPDLDFQASLDGPTT